MDPEEGKIINAMKIRRQIMVYKFKVSQLGIRAESRNRTETLTKSQKEDSDRSMRMSKKDDLSYAIFRSKPPRIR